MVVGRVFGRWIYWGLQIKLLKEEVEPEHVFSGLVPVGEEGNMKQVLREAIKTCYHTL
jgi:hypothetical protein